MSKCDDHVFIQHILDAAREALLFSRGKTERDLIADRQYALAVVKCLEIIGEAANKLSESCRAGQPSVPWRKIVGMRNRLVHDYSAINYQIVWKIVHDELPDLIAVLETHN